MADIEKVIRAINCAAFWHKDQRRDHGIPYVNHCIQVTNMVADYTDDINTLCGSTLHDSLEDTKLSEASIKQEFGSDVLLLVKQLTNDYPDNLEHADKMLAVAKHAKDITDRRAQIIKLADRLCNLGDCETWKPKRIAKYLINTEVLLKNLPVSNADKETYWYETLVADISDEVQSLMEREDVVKEYKILCGN
jgi:(p)ppGpp synthase/HD superfamily hydrolase